MFDAQWFLEGPYAHSFAFAVPEKIVSLQIKYGV